MLGQSPVDILISTPGRVATILRTKSTTLNLSNLQAIVLDEVDVLLIDDTFGPQLRTIGAASPVAQVQFVFVTATLPNEIIESVKREFKDVGVIQGPGLHRVAPNLKEHLVDVSVPSTENKNLDLCFEFKAKELMKALRSNRCKRTLVFCNTVETCRKVENLIKRSDRRGRVFGVGAYHNAMTPESRRRNLSVFAKGLDREVKAGRKEVVDHVLVCTERAARGVDFDAAPVNHVVIFDFPKDPAEYVRRVGRTARAGRSGTSTVFAFAWQLPIARKIMGSKLESYTVAAEQFGKDEDAEYSQKQRQRSKKMQDQMIRGNIEKGVSWK
jgi:ATP-dependent RNA helicase DDX18/HAS1